MTVKELIEELKGYDQNREILLSSDEEGNHFYEEFELEEDDYHKEKGLTPVLIFYPFEK